MATLKLHGRMGLSSALSVWHGFSHSPMGGK